MTAEDSTSNLVPLVSIPKGTTTEKILCSIKIVVPFFLSALKTHPNKKSINENGLTQIFVTQLNIYLASNLEYPFLTQTQYSDTYFGTKGIPDFFFHYRELGQDFPAIFVVEAKRLPSPEKSREKEYVIGEKIKTNSEKECNGGIERFKNEKHGKGLKECGMLGFIEENDSSHWLKTINEWIGDLAQKDTKWKKDEELKEYERNKESTYLKSDAHTVSAKKILLHHFWVDIKTN